MIPQGEGPDSVERLWPDDLVGCLLHKCARKQVQVHSIWGEFMLMSILLQLSAPWHRH